MLKFFRKIRQNLILEGKSVKYLKYALGEIILVVIGILIALQINNWNDQKKNKSNENVYYQKLLEDFELDKKLIDNLFVKADYRIATSKEILIELDSATKDKYYLINKFLLATRGDIYVPRDVTFKDLISSGNLKLINDIKIKNSLIQYYSELENKRGQLKQNRDEVTQRVFDLVHSIDINMIQEFNYVNEILGPEIFGILPQNEWNKDKNSENYKKFQLMVLFNIAMSDREKQHLTAINSLMEEPYQLLVKKCNIQ